MKVLNIRDIRGLIINEKSKLEDIARECLRALMARTETDIEHAELLCYYAEAAARLNPARAFLGIEYVEQAITLAEKTGEPVMLARAYCLRVRLRGLRGQSRSELKKELLELLRDIEAHWRLSTQQQERITKLFKATSNAIDQRTFLPFLTR